ncbi:unnamed protein product [Hydatigera taeniaeformis]|uniref:AN1-type domain-containing protein n=1 Tax=Hydatigena taeniaeformis TaxID=6205 RepID=A0A0R3X5G7_HYDTA|nr:unnamed protein product [Hydatigera taeniaeformis]
MHNTFQMLPNQVTRKHRMNQILLLLIPPKIPLDAKHCCTAVVLSLLLTVLSFTLLSVEQGMVCACGGTFCTTHRFDDRHNCPFDYQSDERERLRKANPPVLGEKVKKI